MPLPIIFITRAHRLGNFCLIPLIPWSGICSGSTSIGSFPPSPKDHLNCTSTPSCTHPLIPCSTFVDHLPSDQQEVMPCLHFVMYRIRFRQIEHQVGPFAYPYNPGEVTVTHIRFTRFWSPDYYPEDYPYTANTPLTPPRTP